MPAAHPPVPTSFRDRVQATGWRRRIAAHRAAEHVYRSVVGVSGATISLIGLATIPLPGPGWLIVFGGLFVLATEFTWAERLLVATRRRVQTWSAWAGRQPLTVRVMLTLAAGVAGAAVLVVMLHVTGIPGWMPAWVPLWR